MSKLENLLKEFCPEGVEYRKLGAICHIEKGKTPIQKATPGEFPLVVTADERLWCDSYQFDCNAVCIPLISSSGHGKKDLRTIHYQSGKFALGNILCAVIPNNERYISAQFLYVYLLARKDFLIVPLMRGGANVSLSTDSLKNIKVPVPPLEVQQEIVRILNQFTQLTAELTAELTARKQQYEYYRNNLLESFPNDVEVQFGKLFEFQNGFAFKSKLFKKMGQPVLRITNIRENHIDESNLVYFDTADYKENLNPFIVKPGDIVVAMSGATTGKIGINKSSKSYYLNQRVGKFIPNTDIILEKYLYYLLLQNSSKLLEISQGTGAQPNLSSEKLKKLTVKVPPLPEQRRIVAILDRFDALCNDLTSGLPAEIAARQKQYEYYRDKLLTFPQRKEADA